MSGVLAPSCPACFSEAVEVLHESSPEASSSHATLRCLDCQRVFKAVLEEPNRHEVACVISKGAESQHTTVQLEANDKVQVDEEIHGHGHRLLVTAIEDQDGRRVPTATAEEIGTIWCKLFDTVTVNVAVNKGHITHSDELETTPEEEFFVGDVIRIHNQQVRIKAIKTQRGIKRRGSAQAREVVRMFTERTDWREEQQEREKEAHREKSRPKRYRDENNGGGRA